jgi:DNA-binding response OmpR family regulator
MPQILIIEDEAEIREILVHVLKRNNYYTRQAENGASAVKQLRAYPADLVITDMLMPDMEGVELIKILRREFPVTKIIAISGGGFGDAQDYLKIASALGAHKVMTKPFQLNELLDAVSELLHPPPSHTTPGTTR